MICERVAVDTGMLQPCPLRDIPCGLLPPESCPVLRTIQTDVCKFWQCGLAQILKIATSEPFDWLGAILLGLTGLVLLGGALGLMAYRRRRGGQGQDVVIESPPSTDYDTSSNSESEEPEPETSQPPPRPPLPTEPIEPLVNFCLLYTSPSPRDS